MCGRYGGMPIEEWLEVRAELKRWMHTEWGTSEGAGLGAGPRVRPGTRPDARPTVPAPAPPDADPAWQVTPAARGHGGASVARPTDTVVGLRMTRRGVKVGTYRWGLIPAWATDPTRFRHTFNARSETVASLDAFRDAWRAGQRCVLGARTITEWVPGPTPRAPKQMVVIARADGHPFRLAGLWSAWRNPATGAVVGTCAMLTCPPSPAWARVHDRMPVVLELGQIGRWLDPGTSPEHAHAMCRPSAAALTVTPQHPAARPLA